MTDIRKAIKSIALSGRMEAIIGTITEVDEDQRLCTIEPLNGDAIVYDVRLQAAIGDEHGVVLIPKVGAYGIAVFIADNAAFLALFGEVEKVIWGVDKQVLEFTKDGLSLSNDTAKFAEEQTKLIDTISAILDTLLQFQLATNVGPTISVMPQVVTLLNKHKADLTGIKTNLNTLIY
jgi:hypothetical protein